MIKEFSGEHAFLSNFFPSYVAALGRVYPTVEHAYQAMKSGDPEGEVLRAPTPGKAKRLGKILPLREDWEDVKLDVMRALLGQKFSPGSYLAGLLLATGEVVLVEGNNWNDRFWGVCRGSGQNWLGRLLMEQRRCLK